MSRHSFSVLHFSLIFFFIAGTFLPVHSSAVVLEPSQQASLLPDSTDDDLDIESPTEEIDIEHVRGEVLVKFRDGVTAYEIEAIHTEVGGELLTTLPTIEVQKIRALPGISTDQLLLAYKSRPQVAFAEPNVIFRIQRIPNDPRFSELWGLHNTGQTLGTPDADIDAPEAWDLQTGSSSVIVADIDTGVDYSHPDLTANMWRNPGEVPANGIDDDRNGFVDDVYGWDFANNDSDPMDDNGHGTHTAGTIAAAGNNGVGVAGVSWNAKIMALKFLGGSGGGSVEAAAQAVLYASQMGVKISSNSWGCTGYGLGCYSETLEAAIKVAHERGMLFVTAAGNDNFNNDGGVFQSFPCNYTVPNVLCVAATDHNDQRAAFSSYGATSVDLAAPGVNILSTVPAIGNPCCSDPSGYKSLGGTSMATPHVAGAATLLLSQFPLATSDEAKNLLMDTVDAVPALSGLVVTGGRLNVNQAVRSNFALSGQPTVRTVWATHSTSYTITVRSLNGFSQPVTLSVISPNTNITGSLNVTSVTPPTNGTVTATLTVSSTAALAGGVYFVTVRGTNALGETHSARVALVIQDFSAWLSPGTAFATPNSVTGYGVWIGSFYRHEAPVTLTFVSPHANITGRFSETTVTTYPDGVTVPLLDLTIGSVPLGQYTITVDASDGVQTRRATATLIIVGSDLVVNEVSAPASATIGSFIPITDTTTNQGVGPTDGRRGGGFTNHYYLSPDPIISLTDIWIGKRIISEFDPSTGVTVGLAAGESSTGEGSGYIPARIPAGTYYIGAIADADWDLIVETNENNNTRAGNTITITGPDLVMTAVSGSATGSPGGNIVISQTARNQGTASAGAFGVGLYLSTDPLITQGDIFLGSRTINALAAGENSSGNTTVTLPANLLSGRTYYLGAIADDPRFNSVMETNEDNNALTGNIISIPLTGPAPDLVVTAVGGPSAAVTSSVITFTATVANQGTASAGMFDMAFVLSTDTLIDNNDRIFYARNVGPSLAAGANSNISYNTWIATEPSWMQYVPAGTYYIGAIADPDNLVSEANEGNNTRIGNTITVTLGADLVVTGLTSSHTSAMPGARIIIQDAFKNQGTGQFYFGDCTCSFGIGFYLSTDATITTSDIAIGSRPAYALMEPGQVNSGITTVILPPNLAGGTYYIGAIVDPGNVAMENNEANNTSLSIPITITIGTDLVVSALSGPTSASPGQSVALSNTVSNSGTGNAAAFAVGLYLSTDATITTADTFLGSRTVGSLAAGASSAATTTATIPAGLAPGTYYLGGIADSLNQVAESNEANNARTGNTISIATVTVAVDLITTALSGPISAAPEGQIDVSSTVRNQGTSSADALYVGFYLSTDATITTSDTYLGSRLVNSLAAGVNNSATTTLTVPANVTLQTYYLGGIVDYDNQVAESNETNNAQTGNSIVIE